MRTGSAAVSEIPGQLYMMVVDNNRSKTGVCRAKSNASRQGIVVDTMNGAERHLHISGTTFRIPVRYNNLKVIGKGSYGVVCSAVDSLRKKPVAIKKITPMAAHSTDAKHVLREVRVMRHLGQHENIVTLEDLFSNNLEDELYIVMELLDSDLHRVIQSPQVFTTQHHRLFMIQILRGVEFLHQNDVIHRDLKPGNILVTRNWELRISDFGLARGRLKTGRAGAESCDEDGMTEHVVTRWYRPPELMLSPNGFYGFSVDIWSVGCIFGELIGRQPLFPGSGFKDQLSLIFDVLGAPAPEEIVHIRGAQARKFLEQVKIKKGVSFMDLLPGINSDAASLLTNLLLFDPDKRCTASEALLHSFFEDFRNDDPLKGDLPTDLHFEFEHRSVSTTTLRDLIAKEVDYFQLGANLKIHKRREAYTVDYGRLCVPAVTAATTAAAAAVAATSAAFSTREDAAPANRYYSASPDGLGDSGGKRRGHPPRPSGKQSTPPFPKSRYGGAAGNTGKDVNSLNADSRRSSRRRARSSKAPRGPASVVVGGYVGAEMNNRVPSDLDEEDDDTEFYPWLTTAGAAVRGEGTSWRENLEIRKKNDDDIVDKAEGNQRENAKCTTYCPARNRSSTEGNVELCAITESKEESSPCDVVQPEECSGSSVAEGERGGKRETEGSISGTPMKPTRIGSVAGFPRGNDGWDEDADGSDPRTRARNFGTAVTVLSPASLRNVLLARGVSGCGASSAKERSECRDSGKLGNNLIGVDTGDENDNHGDRFVGEVDDAKVSKDTPAAIRQCDREKRAWQLGRAKAKAETDAAARRQSMKLSGCLPRNVENGRTRASAPVLPSRVRDSQRLSAPRDARSGAQNDPATPWDGSGGCCSTETEAHGGGRGTASNPMEDIEKMCSRTCYGEAAAASEAVDSLRFRSEEVVASLEKVPPRESNEGDFGGASWRTVKVSGDTGRLISGNVWRREVVGARCEDGVGLGNCMVPPRACLAPVDSDTVIDLMVPMSCAGNLSAGGQDSIESSRCSPPPVPPPLGHRWARHEQARYMRPADQGHSGCPRDDVGVVVSTIEEDTTLPPPRQRLEEKAPLEITALRFPIRAGPSGGYDAVERNRAFVSPTNPTEDPGDVTDLVPSTSTTAVVEPGYFYPSATVTRKEAIEEDAPLVLKLPSRLLSPSTPTSTSTEASSDDELCGDGILLPLMPIDAEPEASSVDTSTAGGRGQYTPIVLRLPSRIRESLCERRRESEHKPRICPLDELARSSDDHDANALASAWLWSLAEERVRTGEAGKVEELGSREDEINAGAPATSPPTGLSSEALAVDRGTPAPIDDGPSTTMNTSKAPPLSTSLASKLPDADQQEATPAGKNFPPPRRAVAKPWGVPVGEAVSARPVLGISESTDEDRSESSVGSVEHKFNLLQRLWKRSSAGKRDGELGALSTHTSGPSVFDGTTAKGAGNQPSATDEKTSRTWIIQAAASIPMSQKTEFKEALTTASQNRMASNTTSSLSPASSAASRVDAFYSAAPSDGSARASSIMSQHQARGHRRELSATVPPLRVDFPLKRESPANEIRTGSQSIERRERMARESARHGAEAGRTRSDGVERRTILEGDPCVEDQIKTPQCCAPLPSPPEAGRPSREGKREKSSRRVQIKLAAENPPVLPRRGTVTS